MPDFKQNTKNSYFIVCLKPSSILYNTGISHFAGNTSSTMHWEIPKMLLHLSARQENHLITSWGKLPFYQTQQINKTHVNGTSKQKVTATNTAGSRESVIRQQPLESQVHSGKGVEQKRLSQERGTLAAHRTTQLRRRRRRGGSDRRRFVSLLYCEAKFTSNAAVNKKEELKHSTQLRETRWFTTINEKNDKNT